MNVLQIHNFYISDGGEEVVVKNEKKILKEKGIHVFDFYKYNKNISFFRKVKLFFSTHYSNQSKKDFYKLISSNSIDIVHIHNLFPQITPSILDVAFERDIPVVYTLHNYRLVHPNGLLYFNGHIDERSLKGSAYRCIWNGVYRNSKLLTAVVAHMIEFHRRKNTWAEKVNYFIVPTSFAKNKLSEGGIPSDKMVVKPHFVYPEIKPLIQKKKQFLFLGRLVQEKGIETVLSAWDKLNQNEYELVIAGDGPLLDILKRGAPSNVKWIGKVKNEEVFSYINKSIALIFSSEWYETFGLTIIESFAMGVPVICSDLGSHAELVEHEQNGILYTPGDSKDLAKSMDRLINDESLRVQLGLQARAKYEYYYDPEKNYEQLMDIYHKAIAEKKY